MILLCGQRWYSYRQALNRVKKTTSGKPSTPTPVVEAISKPPQQPRVQVLLDNNDLGIADVCNE